MFGKKKYPIIEAWINEKERSMSTEEISFLNGNRNTPVLVLGPDPSNTDVDIRNDDGVVIQKAQDNILIVPLGVAQSVPRDTVKPEETEPTHA